MEKGTGAYAGVGVGWGDGVTPNTCAMASIVA